jgi:hypothetical protein
MTRAGLVMRRCAISAAFSLVFGTAQAGDTPAPIGMHRAHRPPVASTLAPPRLIGDATTRLARLYSGKPIDMRTYHYTTLRTGWNANETDLTPATVASPNFGLLATLQVDGNVLAQPLLVARLPFPDKSFHDVLIVVTGHDSVYAFDAQTYALLWQVSLGQSQSSADVGCGDVLPEYGIDSTPVIVRSSSSVATLYLVAATEPAPGTFVSTLHALDVRTGLDVSPPVPITASALLSNGSTVQFDPHNQWVRAGLAAGNNSIYVAVGSHCDHNPGGVSGWLLRYTTGLQQLAAFHTVQTVGSTELAGIWMTGFAPVIIPGGSVLVATGNGDTRPGAADWGESILKLHYDLSHVDSWYTDPNYSELNTDDDDLGSGGVMVLPPVAGQTGPTLAVQMGKSGLLLLLNANQLGKLGHPLQTLYYGGGLWGGPAYYDGPAGPTVYTQTGADVLRAWSVTTGSTPSMSLSATGTSAAGFGGSLPIVSSNGSLPDTGVVWLINRSASPFSLEAYDASSLGAPIFSAQVGVWSNAAQGNPFLTPMEVNGRVYAPGYEAVQVFGLTP